jgi:hypothetical protein
MVIVLNRLNRRLTKENQARGCPLKSRLELDVSEYDEDGAGHSTSSYSLIHEFGIFDTPPACNSISRPVATRDNYVLSMFYFYFWSRALVSFFSLSWFAATRRPLTIFWWRARLMWVSCLHCRPNTVRIQVTLTFHYIGNHENTFYSLRLYELGDVPRENVLDSAFLLVVLGLTSLNICTFDEILYFSPRLICCTLMLLLKKKQIFHDLIYMTQVWTVLIKLERKYRVFEHTIFPDSQLSTDRKLRELLVLPCYY